MNTDARMTGAATDKFELHYRQQLSALVDGELATDEARFLLRRLEHDGELSACQERWQLLGDVLRGNACAPAPADFGLRVREAMAADAAQAAAAPPRKAARGGWRRWGGGAALAASVAAVALFMAREQLPEPALPQPVIATTAELPAAPVAAVVDADTAPAHAAAVAGAVSAVAIAAAPRQETRRGSATRNQQVARVAARQSAPARAMAVQAAPVAPALRQDPFAQGAEALQAKPWPRSALPQGALNASFPAARSSGASAFYPFEPRLPAADDAASNTLAPQR